MATQLYNGELTLHNHGIKMKRCYPGRPADWVRRCMGDKCGKRGKQITFSRASALNLRRKLIDLPWGQGIVMYGITLTLQADAYASVENPVETLRAHWHSFCETVIALSRNRILGAYFSFVWRIELTQKGTPHYHCIICTNFPPDVLLFQSTWMRLVHKWYGYTAHENVMAQYRRIDNCQAAFAYVGAHACKHKRDQLGWQGRQWGIICPTATAKAFYKGAAQVGQKGTLPSPDLNPAVLRFERRQGSNRETPWFIFGDIEDVNSVGLIEEQTKCNGCPKVAMRPNVYNPFNTPPVSTDLCAIR